METREKKWRERRTVIGYLGLALIEDRLSELEKDCCRAVDHLNERIDVLQDKVDALEEIVKYLDTHEESTKVFDDMFDSPLDTLEEIFKI